MSEPGTERDETQTPERTAEWYRDRPQARMSFTRLAAFRRCPAWFRHQYLEWHRTWDIPVMRAGHAVQGVLERVFDSTPAAEATPEDVEVRAGARATALFREIWERERMAFDADPNGAGSWNLSRERYEGYVLRGVNFHVREVLARLERRHPRTGAPLDLPAVATVAEAWKAVRPWHAVKNGDDDFGLEAIPGGWFQGQYDLVYTWTGARRIVDLKASTGMSAFSTEIEGQLLSYAWMERELGRGRPEALEGWFLGQPATMPFPVPGDAELDAFTAEVRDLIRRSRSEEEGFNRWRAGDFPESPAPVPGMSPREGEPSAWCAVCPFAYVCPKSLRRAPSPGAGIRFDDPFSPAREVTIEGLVLGVGKPRIKNGKEKTRVTIANESGIRSFGWDRRDVDRLSAGGLRAGRSVRLTSLNPWRPPDGGALHFFSSPNTRVEVLADPWPDAILDPGEF